MLGEQAAHLGLGHHAPVDVVEGGQVLALPPVDLVADQHGDLAAQPRDEIVMVAHPALPSAAGARPGSGRVA